MAVPKNVNLTDEQKRVLEMATEFYIRLGLGQFSEIATRLNLLHGNRIDPDKMERIRQLCEEMEELTFGDGKPWTLKDDETSIYTLTAFLTEAQMAGNKKNAKWAEERIAELKELNKEKIQ
jgi:replicative superfamily II helicase